jgi:hypothetical protein
MTTRDGRYTERSVDDKSFERNKDFLKPPRAADGEAPNKPLDPGLKQAVRSGPEIFRRQ